MSYSDEVKAAAQGRWLEILTALTGSEEIQRAAQRLGRHGPCPVHGGRDGFRFFRDANATGGCICNTCGAHPDGWATLMWVNSWDFPKAVEEVGRYLGIEKRRPTPQQRSRVPRPQQPARASQQRQPAHQPAAHARQKVAVNSTETSRPQAATVGMDHRPLSGSDAKQTPPQESRQAQLKKEALKKAINVVHHRSQKVEVDVHEVLNPKAEALWNEALPLNAQSGIEAYLRSRGIALGSARWQALVESDAVRFHPKCPYRDDDLETTVGTLPAMLAAIRDEHGRIVTVHRTYLNASMKKARRIKYEGRYLSVTAKKMMSTSSVWEKTGKSSAGSAIKLTEPRKGVLSLAEGIETALAAFRATGIPVWAAVNATMLEKVRIPDDVKLLIIWADRDRSGTGEKSALKLRNRLRQERPDVDVHILLPPLGIPKGAKGVDWNDVLVSQGVMGFPIERLRRVMEYLQDSPARQKAG
ncbi:hypothetical protein D6779_04455 [Candidatus Parcubacteria bacterium]|nr:MAG: hypothetical protein D6779_04455 [Candidatus Parcubacteria bacterium]